MKKHIYTIIFWGAVWGLVEATLGHALHIVTFKIGWVVWFPIAFFFMNRVYAQTGESLSVIITAGIAALIKLIDLINPIRIDFVINPSVSIMFEALTMFVCLKILEKNKGAFDFITTITVSTIWRALYLVFILLMPAWWIKISVLGEWDKFLHFFIFENVVNSILIVLTLKLLNILKQKGKNEAHVYSCSPYVSVLLLVLTVYVQWAL